MTVTRDGWGVSTQTGTGIKDAILHVYKFRNGYRNLQKGEGYGKIFPSTDAAFAWALERGYLQEYRKRTWCKEHRILHTSWNGKPSPTFGTCYVTFIKR